MSLSPAPLNALVASAIRKATSGRLFQTAPWRREITDSGIHRCLFCLADLTAESQQPRNSFLVSPLLGGPKDDENRIIVCQRCAKSRDNHDVLGWPAFARLGTDASRAHVLALRSEILTLSANHLTPTRAGAPRHLVMAALEKRHANPRFKVYAFHGGGHAYFGWTPRCGGDQVLAQAAAILRFSFQASPTPDRRLSLFEVPVPRFLDAVWELIELGALVEPVSIPGIEPAPIDLDLWQHWWQATFTHVSDLIRRRPRLAGNHARVPGTLANAAMKLRANLKLAGVKDVSHIDGTLKLRQAPRPPRPLSTSPTAVINRNKYRKQARDNRERAWLVARADLEDYKKRVREGRALPASLEEMTAMEEHVMDLFEAIEGAQ